MSRAWWDEDENGWFVKRGGKPREMTILDVDRPPEWSGLYDAEGRKLYHEPAPFGFRRGQP